MTTKRNHIDSLVTQVMPKKPAQKQPPTPQPPQDDLKPVATRLELDLIQEMDNLLAFMERTPMHVTKRLFISQALRDYIEKGKKELIKQGYLKKDEPLPDAKKHTALTQAPF